ncbi:MAG: glutathione S-transferase N-terminal domain-containing protein [Rickettsiales bacterium]|nr:glutathione S-transferase N-terminal domain-containing protein [Rickettsiales bacterium]
MRARMALHYAGIAHTQVEVDLKYKPQALLVLSPKGTVPVLHLADGSVLEQSFDIMTYALAQNDPEVWRHDEAEALVAQNDVVFKPLLDRYKYHIRYPEKSALEHRMAGEGVLKGLEERLSQHGFLVAERPTLADFAVMPFIRQWHGVDGMSLPGFPLLSGWLQKMIDNQWFKMAMAVPSPA